MALHTAWREMLAKVLPGSLDRRGAMAITIAIVMVALLGTVALATDTSQAISAHARLGLAADAAALTALRAAAAAYAHPGHRAASGEVPVWPLYLRDCCA